MALDTYLLYLASLAVFFATPPDTSQLLLISNSMRHGLRRSVWTLLGDLSANCVQMTTAAFGLTATISSAGFAFEWIKWLGVIYLAWLGLRLFITRDDQAPSLEPANVSRGNVRLFRQGFFTSMANPYAVIFFAALFPQFLDLTQGIFVQLFILGSTYLVIDGALLLLWGWLAHRVGVALRVGAIAVVQRISGALMLGAAMLLASKDFESER